MVAQREIKTTILQVVTTQIGISKTWNNKPRNRFLRHWKKRKRQPNRRWYIFYNQIGKTGYDFLSRNKFCFSGFEIIFRMFDIFGCCEDDVLHKINRIVYFFGSFGFDVKIVIGRSGIPNNGFFCFGIETDRIGFYHLRTLFKNGTLRKIAQRIFDASGINFFFFVVVNNNSGRQFVILILKNRLII